MPAGLHSSYVPVGGEHVDNTQPQLHPSDAFTFSCHMHHFGVVKTIHL